MLLAQTMGYFLNFPMPKSNPKIKEYDFYDYPCTKPLCPESPHLYLKFVTYMRKLKYCTSPALSINTVYSSPTAYTPLTNFTTISDLLKLSKVFFKNVLAKKVLKTSTYHSSVLDRQQSVRNLKWTNLNRVQSWDIGCEGGLTGFGKKEGGCYIGYFKGKGGIQIGSLAKEEENSVTKAIGQGEEREYLIILANAEADSEGFAKEGTGKPGKELTGAFCDLVKMLKSVKYLSDKEEGANFLHA